MTCEPCVAARHNDLGLSLVQMHSVRFFPNQSPLAPVQFVVATRHPALSPSCRTPYEQPSVRLMVARLHDFSPPCRQTRS